MFGLCTLAYKSLKDDWLFSIILQKEKEKSKLYIQQIVGGFFKDKIILEQKIHLF